MRNRLPSELDARVLMAERERELLRSSRATRPGNEEPPATARWSGRRPLTGFSLRRIVGRGLIRVGASVVGVSHAAGRWEADA